MAAWKLTSDEWDAIDRFRFTTKDAREFRNALIILKSGAGASKREIAEDLGCSEATVQNIRRWYREEGIAGLHRQSPPGRSSRADAKYRAVLRKVLRTSPLDLGYGFSVWSAARLGAHLEKVTGSAFSVWQLRRIMKEEGFSVQRPKHTMHGKRDETAFEHARAELDVLKKTSLRKNAREEPPTSERGSKTSRSRSILRAGLPAGTLPPGFHSAESIRHPARPAAKGHPDLPAIR